MKNVILVSFNAATPVVAGVYCDGNYTAGGGIR